MLESNGDNPEWSPEDFSVEYRQINSELKVEFARLLQGLISYHRSAESLCEFSTYRQVSR